MKPGTATLTEDIPADADETSAVLVVPAKAKVRSVRSAMSAPVTTTPARVDEDDGDDTDGPADGAATILGATAGPTVAPDTDTDTDTEADTGPDVEVADDTGGSASRAARLRSWLTANAVAVTVTAVVVVGALVVALALTLSALGSRNALEGARVSALAAARADTVAVASYDYRHLNRDFGVVLGRSTPSFHRSFLQTSKALRTTLAKFHATADAKVVSAGVVSATASRVVVLVLLDQKVTNTTHPKATTDRSQVEITLVRSGGRWLINTVNLL